jgi:hypothetical protein
MGYVSVRTYGGIISNTKFGRTLMLAQSEPAIQKWTSLLISDLAHILLRIYPIILIGILNDNSEYFEVLDERT